MIYPCLVLKQHCKTSIKVTIESEGVDEDGSPKKTFEWEGKCNYQSRDHKVYTEEKVWSVSSGTCLIRGDIAPSIPIISSGTVEIFGMIRRIVVGAKLRNPDGTVNYTRLELE